MSRYNDNEVFVVKKHVLDNFIEDNKFLPKQGSPEWLENRQYTIGGSEIATIEGLNPYQSIKDLVKTKLNISPFKGNVATQWGKLFEEVVRLFLEMLFECTIYETGSIDGCIPHTSFSPDGLAVTLSNIIYDLIELGWIKDHVIPDDATTILFEIKSPYSRKPDGTIPKHYSSQPKAGLCHLPFVDIAYFVDAMMRKCSYEQLYNNEHDYAYHGYSDLHGRLGIGLIGVFSNEEFESNDNLIDFGKSNKRTFNNLLKDIGDSKYRVHYFSPSFNIIFNWLQMFNEFCEKNNVLPIGYIPYKILMCEIIPVYRDDNYVANLSREIEGFFDVIEQLKKSDDILAAIDNL